MIPHTPEGYKRVWLPEDSTHWRIADYPGPCRYLENGKGCKQPSVAQIKRDKTWWHYCANHLYGRRIRNGAIEFLGLVRI